MTLPVDESFPSLKEPRSSMQLRTIIVGLIVVNGGIAACIASLGILTTLYSEIYLGAMTSQVSLIGLWAGLSPARWQWRAMACLLSVFAATVLLMFAATRADFDALSLTFPCCGIPALGCLVFRFRATDLKQLEHVAGAENSTDHLLLWRHLFIGIAIVSSILGLEWIINFTEHSYSNVRNAYEFSKLGISTLVLSWAALGRHWHRSRSLIVTLFSVALLFLPFSYLDEIIWIQIASILLLVGTHVVFSLCLLLLVRQRGHRLVEGRIQFSMKSVLVSVVLLCVFLAYIRQEDPGEVQIGTFSVTVAKHAPPIVVTCGLNAMSRRPVTMRRRLRQNQQEVRREVELVISSASRKDLADPSLAGLKGEIRMRITPIVGAGIVDRIFIDRFSFREVRTNRGESR